MNNKDLFNEENFPLVFAKRHQIINIGVNILENPHDFLDIIPPSDFAFTFFKKLSSNSEKRCTTLRGKVPTFIMRVLISAGVLQTKNGISCTGTYFNKFQNGEIYDPRSLMKKYINEYLSKCWKPPRKRRPKGGKSINSFCVDGSMSTLTGTTTGNPYLTNIQNDRKHRFKGGKSINPSFVDDSMSTLTGTTTSNPYLTNIQNDDALSFKVTKAMEEFTDDCNKYDDVTSVQYTTTRTV